MFTQDTQIEQTNNLVVATISAREMTGLDMQELVDELIQRMRYDNARFFILDLASVELLASDCLGVLVTFLRDLEHKHGSVVLAACRPNVAFLFKVTRLDTVFGLFDDLDSAREDVGH